LAAYDWIYNDLSEEERRDIGTPLLNAISYMPSADRGSVFRRNTGGIKTGFYGPPCLPWYAGIVFHKTGIDDSLSVQLLQKGYDDHIALLNHRSEVTGDDGGAASAVLGYCMGAYPWAEYNFFHTFHSATGYDLSQEWPYVPRFINYIFWNWLPGDRHFGYGDANHRDNALPSRYLHLHLAQMIHFYGKTQPDLISLAKWMQTRVQKQHQGVFPWTRFLLTNEFDEIKPEGPSEQLPLARHFENMGQLFMRSGSGPDDTYALFTAGGMLTQHRHYDNNNFVIFKKGYLTLDTGTRPQPGLHLSHYYARTVAHNCITIKMPGEIIPPYWDSGPALSEREVMVFPNDGGQHNMMGSEVIAFDESDEYVYIASDATASYHPDKAEIVIRQLLFLPPDHFVVFDRVSSTNPGYDKRWLLHTAAEPRVKSDEFQTDHWGGRLFCRTLFPENAELNKIGGPGKQFWSDGRNWALPELTPDDWNYKNMNWLDNSHDLFGQWRIEVTPDKSNTDDIFLHLIQVGDRSLQSMSISTPLKTDDMAGIRFISENNEYKVMFYRTGKTGGKIMIHQNGLKILEEKFSEKVKHQEGLY
jgi:heparin/heparan-sulfate lyase